MSTALENLGNHAADLALVSNHLSEIVIRMVEAGPSTETTVSELAKLLNEIETEVEDMRTEVEFLYQSGDFA